ADEAVQQVDERLPNAMSTVDANVTGVEENDHHPRARVAGRLERFADVVRFAAKLLRSVAADVDVLELLNGLQLAAFANLEVVTRQIGDRNAVARRVRVHAHVVGL